MRTCPSRKLRLRGGAAGVSGVNLASRFSERGRAHAVDRSDLAHEG